jgi:hypothetical protein
MNEHHDTEILEAAPAHAEPTELPPAPEAALQRIPPSGAHAERLAVLEQSRDVAAVAANNDNGYYERLEDLEADVAHCERAQRHAAEAEAAEAAKAAAKAADAADAPKE